MNIEIRLLRIFYNAVGDSFLETLPYARFAVC